VQFTGAAISGVTNWAIGWGVGAAATALLATTAGAAALAAAPVLVTVGTVAAVGLASYYIGNKVGARGVPFPRAFLRAIRRSAWVSVAAVHLRML